MLILQHRGDVGVARDHVRTAPLIEVDRLVISQLSVEGVRILGPVGPPDRGQIDRGSHSRIVAHRASDW